MGSLVAYRCGACEFATEQLQVGWGKAGRARYWGGLAVCAECKDLTVVNLSEARVDRRDRRCARCNGALKMLEGTSEAIPCPRCGARLRHSVVGSWT
jgi:DNA-directed RNA polymerase subunit RPC12/RpoP